MNNLGNIAKPLTWFMSLLMVAFVAGCGSQIMGGGSGGAGLVQNSAKAITAFSILGNAGTINESAKIIAVTVPNGTTLTGLIATFTTTGSAVSVGPSGQVSGTTQNDFTASPVAYVVTALDGSTATYNVFVTVASSSAKAITSFSFVGYPGNPGTISGTASPYSIAVTMPSNATLTSLTAKFTTTGTSVAVGSLVQTSGTTTNDFTSQVAYVVSAADGTTATYNVTVTKASATAKAITAYTLAGVAGVITEPAHTIAVVVPNGTVVTALVATFTTTGVNVAVGATTQISGTTPNNFSGPVAYVVTDGNGLTATYNVTVTLAAANPTAPTLGESGRFAILAYAGVTTTGVTAISNGDIGITPTARTGITGFTASGAAGDYTQLTGSTWPGMLSTSYAPADSNPAPFPYPLHYAAPHAVWTTTGAMLTQSSGDETIAYNFLAADPNPGAPTQVCPTELGTLTLTRGVYKTASNVGITTGTLNLDAQGDPNAVWIFNISGTLTTGAPGGSIAFVGGIGSAKNVYWRVAGNTSIGANTTFIGNVYDAGATVSVLSGVNITGSLFSTAGSVTLIGDTITKP